MQQCIYDLRWQGSAMPDCLVEDEFKLLICPVFFFQALIRHYCYEKYFHHAVNVATAAQRKFSNDPIYTFLRAYGVLMQGKHTV